MQAMEAPSPDRSTANPSRNRIDYSAWKPLRFLTVYRVILALLLAVLFFSSSPEKVLGGAYPRLYGSTVVFYVMFSLISFFDTFRTWHRFEDQVITQIIADIVLITILMYASGGVFSGLGTVMVVALAAGGLLLPGRMAYVFAALASVAVLAETSFAALVRGLVTWTEFGHAGVLGVAFFATAAMAHLLAQRTRDSEALAARQGVDLANLERLNEYVIQHMAIGILVVDSKQSIRLINETAAQMLSLPEGTKGRPLAQASSHLLQCLVQWQAWPEDRSTPFRPGPSQPTVLPRFQSLGTGRATGTVIFLEDPKQLAQQAQQMKLAALGRLTASIAHEIRNPLGAISHAGQLLAESTEPGSNDQRMTEIIQAQCQRVNTIVENVLQLSRRQNANAKRLVLDQWLTEFADEFQGIEKLDRKQIHVRTESTGIGIKFDTGHLHQVVWNLCSNALQHANPAHGPVRLQLLVGLTEGGRPFLEIADNGTPITPEAQQQLFEPFYTTTSKGTGLGLYIARELCELNQAHLEYRGDTSAENSFRISFAGP